MTTSDQLRKLQAKWADFKAVSSTPGDLEDDTSWRLRDAFAKGTKWGLEMATRDLGELLEGEVERFPVDGVNLPLTTDQLAVLVAGGMVQIRVPDADDPENVPDVLVFVRGPKPEKTP